LGAAHVDPAFLVVPGGNAVSPPDLPRDAPILDVVQPVEVGLGPVLGDELDSAVAHALDGGFGDALAPAGAAIRQHVAGQVHEPLIGEIGFDDGVGTVTARH